MQIWLRMTWNTAKDSKMLAHDWFMEIDLIPNAYVTKFLMN